MKINLTGNKEVFNFCTPYIIAEIGANHNGDMDLARQMIGAAKACGANAAKFQSWTPKSLISEGEYKKNQKYEDSPKKHFGSLREMVSAYYLNFEQHRELKSYCDEIGIDFCSTPFSVEEADMLHELGVEYFKVASMDINNLYLLKHIAALDKPVVISTGMATLSEIEAAVTVVKESGNDKIVLLHCIAIYPPKTKDINLNNIKMLQDVFGLPVGFSDHSIGFSVPLASVALGACVIEKHFTTDKDLPGWDHRISANPQEMEIICKEAPVIAESMGGYRRIVSDAEKEKKLKFRRSIVVSGDLARGHVLTKDDLEFKRPGSGICPDEAQYVIGRKLKTSLSSDHQLSLEDLV